MIVSDDGIFSPLSLSLVFSSPATCRNHCRVVQICDLQCEKGEGGKITAEVQYKRAASRLQVWLAARSLSVSKSSCCMDGVPSYHDT